MPIPLKIKYGIMGGQAMRTPGPWFIKWEFNIFGPRERLVASCVGRQSTKKDEHPENVANARFIVTACNLFNELVEALELIAKQFRCVDPLYSKDLILIKKAEAILAKAKEAHDEKA